MFATPFRHQMKFLCGLAGLLLLGGCDQSPKVANPCLDDYPARAKDVLISDSGRVAEIKPAEWMAEGTLQIRLESGDVIITRPGELPLPPVGAELEIRIYSDSREEMPFAGCYCQKGTDICVEEYTYGDSD